MSQILSPRASYIKNSKSLLCQSNEGSLGEEEVVYPHPTHVM